MSATPQPYVSVVVPWLPSDNHRLVAWRWVRAQLESNHPTWQVVEGRGGTPWVKAEAVADGLERATGDTLVIADADVWADNLDEAVGILNEGARWVIPHRLVHRLNQTATERVLEGALPASAAQDGGYDQDPYPGWAGGGIVVVRRDDYLRAPFDTRFVGWGQEDCSLALALDSVVGRHTRLDAPLWHLWHPPQPRMNRQVGNPESETLWRRYRRAARDRQRMLDLIDEGRRTWQRSS